MLYEVITDRIQVVKGWVDDRGKTQEKVYDVAWSGDRSPGADGKLPPVGNTVDIEAANWTNTIGASELARITSYNVCYTKLLRHPRRDAGHLTRLRRRFFPGFCPDRRPSL